MAIILGSGEMSTANLVTGAAATSANTSSGSYLMYGYTGLNNIWITDRAGIIVALSVQFMCTSSTSSSVYYQPYISGAVGTATPTKAMSTTMSYAYVTGLSVSFSAGTQLNIACYPQGAPGGTLYSSATLTVLYS